MSLDLTVDQAIDLARYLLGPGWTALHTGDPRDHRLALHGPTQILEAKSWRDVFRAAGATLPSRSQYIAKGVRVMLADRAICTAVSNTLAKRIAAALNNHITDRRGI